MTRPSGRHSISIRQNIRPAPFRGERLRPLVAKAASRLADGPADLRILVVDDPEMERWNKEFLGRSGTTNVISFPEETLVREEAGPLKGDILVSAPTCLRQTRGWPGSPEEKVFFFIVHGLLHLLGYDHESGGGRARRMRNREMEVYLSVLGRSRD